MKQTVFTLGASLIIATMLVSCSNGNGSKVLDYRDKIRYGTIETKEGGWSMKAKIDGKDWRATSIMQPDAAGRIIGYYFNREYIGLPYDRRDMVVGKKIKFSENNAVDLSINDDVDLWAGRKGEMEITKVDKNWAEGTFFFTAGTSSSDKTVEVTDGFFRISVAKPQQ